jgi:dGTP triphosphohydrolase
LSQCEREILRAYSEFQERLIGKKAALVEQNEKISRAKQEVETCLKNLPDEISYLRQPLEEALACLEAEKPDEAALEALDEKLEEMIWEKTSEKEKKAALDEVQKEYPEKSDSQLSEIQRIRLIKKIRQTARIPHLSLFYY